MAHAGPSNAFGQEDDAFPLFSDGDVKIMVGGPVQFNLHAALLARNSPKLAVMLTDDSAANLSRAAIKKGIATRFRLVAAEGAAQVAPSDFVDITLEPIGLDESGRPVESGRNGLEWWYLREEEPLIKAFGLVLGSFYGLPMDLGHQDDNASLGSILEMAQAVVSVAEYLDVVQSVTHPVEAALLARGQSLYRSIASAPASWLDFGERIHSVTIFKEALIHGVGQFNTATMRHKVQTGQIQPGTLIILKKHANKLRNDVKGAVKNMTSYFNPNLLVHREEPHGIGDDCGRQKYANKIFMWVAQAVWHHWLSDKVADDQTHNSEDMGFAVFEMISKGRDGYLSKEELNKSFHTHFDMTDKGKGTMFDNLTEIKKDVKSLFLGTSMKTSCMLDTVRYPTGYFTCVDVGEGDYPWLNRQRRETTEEEEEEEEQSGGPTLGASMDDGGASAFAGPSESGDDDEEEEDL